MSDPITRYFELATAADSDAYFAQFAPDAVVEDEGRSCHGIDEIRGRRREVPLVTYRVRSVEPRGAAQHAETEISGDFPGSPVTLDFDFTVDGDRITALTIRPPRT